MYDMYSDPARSRTKHTKENHFKDQLEQEERLNLQQLKLQNQKLKKMLKEAQAKRTQITKECSHLSKTIQNLEAQNQELKNHVRDEEHKCEGEKYRWEQLRFLNKQLTSEIEELREGNQSLSQKLRYNSDILERKYEQLEAKTYKRMEQCAKRVKKAIHYLQSLSVKNLEKTREDLIENLRRSIQLLRGKYYQELNCEGQIEELMNPLKAMQQEIIQKTKQASHYKQQNIRLLEELQKHKQIQKDQIPMFKEAIQKLKKNLSQVRTQLSQNEYEKIQIKKKYEQKLKESEYKYNQIFKQCRKIKLEKKIYQNKLQQLEADVEEQKERLIGQNQMLKKLYSKQNQSNNTSRVSQTSSQYKFVTLQDKKTQQKKALKKNYSSNELKTSNVNPRQSYYQSEVPSRQASYYNQQSSMLSQQNLKDQICRIDQEIIEIQRNLNKELQAYK